MAEVPSGIDDVNAEWLTAVLDDGTVTDVRSERIAEDIGFSSLLYRLHLVGEGVSSSVIVKLPAQSQARGAMEVLGGYQRELSFYRHVAGGAPIQTPRVYAARTAEGSADFVLVLEDLCDWDNADHLVGLSLDRAKLCIEQLAGLHACSIDGRNTAVLEAFPSIDTPIARDLLIPAFGPGWQIYLDESPERVRRRSRAWPGGSPRPRRKHCQC
jgi:Ecdysteroid kinase-like family